MWSDIVETDRLLLRILLKLCDIEDLLLHWNRMFAVWAFLFSMYFGALLVFIGQVIEALKKYARP